MRGWEVEGLRARSEHTEQRRGWGTFCQAALIDKWHAHPNASSTSNQVGCFHH